MTLIAEMEQAPIAKPPSPVTDRGVVISISPKATTVEFKYPDGRILRFMSAAALAKGHVATSEAEPLTAALTSYIRMAWTDDVVGAAHYVGEIFRLGCRVRLRQPPFGGLDVDIGPGPESDAEFERHLGGLNAPPRTRLHLNLINAAIVGFAQSRFAAGAPEASMAFLRQVIAKRGRELIVEDTLLAQEEVSREGANAHVLVRTMAAGGLAYLDYFKDKFCDRPFKDFEVTTRGDVYICCPNNVPIPVGNVYAAESTAAVLNSPAAQVIRNSVMGNDFKYCRWMQCKQLRGGILSSELRGKVQPVVERARKVRLSYDTTCNLWCPSCRKERMTAKGEQLERILKVTDDVVLPALKGADACMMNGYGDVFASQACRKILSSLSRATHPGLSLDFITNGVLFTETEWEKFPGIHDMVRHLRVSIDAATEGTYRSVRRGGDWTKLQENLRFMSRLRGEGRIRPFSISFVYQIENYMEMADFARMGAAIGCDMVILEPLMDWNSYPRAEFELRAIHHPSHALHELFRAEADRVRGLGFPPASFEKIDEMVVPRDRTGRTPMLAFAA